MELCVHGSSGISSIFVFVGVVAGHTLQIYGSHLSVMVASLVRCSFGT
jgi:hypothetical protein